MALAHIRKLAGSQGVGLFWSPGILIPTCAMSGLGASCADKIRVWEVMPGYDGDCLCIEIAGDRLVVWTDAGMQQVALPDPRRSMAELVGSLVGSRQPLNVEPTRSA